MKKDTLGKIGMVLLPTPITGFVTGVLNDPKFMDDVTDSCFMIVIQYIRTILVVLGYIVAQINGVNVVDFIKSNLLFDVIIISECFGPIPFMLFNSIGHGVRNITDMVISFGKNFIDSIKDKKEIIKEKKYDKSLLSKTKEPIIHKKNKKDRMQLINELKEYRRILTDNKIDNNELNNNKQMKLRRK